MQCHYYIIYTLLTKAWLSANFPPVSRETFLVPSLTLYSLTLPLKLPVAINSPLGENLTVQTSSERCRGGGREEERRQKRAVEERDGEYAVYNNMQVHLLLSSLAA